MDSTLRPYPSYKPSNFRWLGDMPAHWEVRRLRNAIDLHVSNVDKHVKEDEHPIRLCNYMDVYKNKYINEQINFMQATATYEEIERFRLERDDVLITKDSETWDDIGVPALVTEPASDLISGYHLALLRPRVHQLAGGYLLHALQSKCLAYQFHIEAKGVTRYGLSQAGIKSVRLPLPPLSEQSAIVCFLDYTERRIRRYIRAKQKLISLLEEQKRAITHQAVTGQVDVRTGQPYPAYKDSGVKWLGEVPKHWEIRRLKTCVTDVIDITSERNPGDIYVASEHVESWTGKINDLDFDSIFESQVKRFRSDDVLFGKLRPYLAKATRPARNGVCVGEFLVLRPRTDNPLPGYLEHWLHSGRVVYAIDASTFGAKMPRADWQFIGNMPFSLPPLPEQAAIVRFLDRANLGIDATVARANREVELLHEYRTRLIADVVTGKLDVREAAAVLPEVAG